MGLPYNHPSNIDQNGQPKMSENAWELLQRENENKADVAHATNFLSDLLVSKKEFLDAMSALTVALGAKADRSSVQTVWAACEKSFATRSLEHIVSDLLKKVESVPSQSDVITLSNFLTAHISQSPTNAELLSSLSLITDKLSKIELAVTALAAKLDTDFTAQNAAVTSSSLDVDYETTVLASLV
jgi:hypothetical protein